VDWVFPRRLLEVHPALGGLGVVLLAGSAAAYGVVACWSGAFALGSFGALYGGFCSLAFSDRPGCLGQDLTILIRRGDRSAMRGTAPYVWRWGLVCAFTALGSHFLGSGGLMCS
jgi:hypothetical protein